MNSLIEKVNRLQDTFTTLRVPSPIDLPQIVVIGSQSSGKSSVLENIVGKDFLPRGSGIVTRRPLVLQLINIPVVPDSDNEWGEFLHLPGERFYEFDRIRAEIERVTAATIGSSQRVSDDPINLRIYSPNVLTLTLVDLPGLTRVPVGDQPPDIEQQIRSMIMKYIVKNNAIILAVTAANTDLANSDGLQLALEVDPQGNRTIGVLTKVDLMDHGTDVISLLESENTRKLKFGYTPVVNRSQRDINQRVRIEDALEAEREFFRIHYPTRAHEFGTANLAQNLSGILSSHIRRTLPDIQLKINEETTKINEWLKSTGKPLTGPGATHPTEIIHKVVIEFSNDYKSAIDGSHRQISFEELTGGARILRILSTTYTETITQMSPMEYKTDEEILNAIYDASGVRHDIFFDKGAFEKLAHAAILRLKPPSIQAVEVVHAELIKISEKLLEKPEFERFPELKQRFREIVKSYIQATTEPTKSLVEDFVEAEAGHINSEHPLFQDTANQPLLPDGADQAPLTPPNDGILYRRGGARGGVVGGLFGVRGRPDPTQANANANKAIQAIGDQPIQETIAIGPQLSDRDRKKVNKMREYLTKYYDIVKQQTADHIPKAIIYKLVTATTRGMSQELLRHLKDPKEVEVLLREPNELVEKRKESERTIDALNRASAILSEFS
ncbi:P-loop containing nucleoside triphosphate hydrolase protein [Polychytrium aggregatum]|uniref:P-loop containing nucleoside triphosphate hydrolase protein n=1 Tax=Polychytrium aggregatum TaxID=110093 RepID=UPI0022FE5CC1|nr:P-loop containing nucleoside triphosphate hydrolase protein [Polychytrium aggregatum]KAI9208897.1 P-loop containing nucleoside triphosphate hydrolase protein [Polychytrium aggregatum]